MAGPIFGPIFPTLIAVLLSHVQPSLHGRTVGSFFANGGIGWAAISLFIGWTAKHTSIERALQITTACGWQRRTLADQHNHAF